MRPSIRKAAERHADTCPECSGNGWILDGEGAATRCTCLTRRIERRKTRNISSTIPLKYATVSFDSPPVTDIEPKMAVKAVRKYVADIDANLDAGRGLWLQGPVGTGKTTLAMLVSKEAGKRGRSVAIYSLPRLLATIKATYERSATDTYSEFFDRIAAVDLLHIDDVGAERQTQWVLEQLYSIVNERYQAKRAMVITTNLDYEALCEQVTERTASRLLEICNCDPLELRGQDRRVEHPPLEKAVLR